MRLQQELAANPVLEERLPENDMEIPLPAADSRSGETADENDYETAAAPPDEWHEELPLPELFHGSDYSGTSAGERDDDPLANSPAPAPDLTDELKSELSVAEAPPEIRRLAMEMTDLLDDRGYLVTPLADLAMILDADLASLETALELLQSLEPAGIGARDLAECFRLQLERRGELPDFMRKLLESGFDDLAANRLPALAKELKISVITLETAVNHLRKLDPAPGASRRSGAAVVQPETGVRSDGEGGFQAFPLRGREPGVIISERYLRMLDDPATDPETRSYLEEKIKRAKELLNALVFRKSTLLRLAEFIALKQQDFMRDGVKHLHPLTMKEAALVLECHETTVSRAASGKYLMTPQGIFPFGFFFSSGVPDSGVAGDSHAVQAVVARMKELIRGEDPRNPLSDEALAEALNAENIAIARRTVAKYREAAGIPKRSLRRKHS